jgi:hypothetical protein
LRELVVETLQLVGDRDDRLEPLILTSERGCQLRVAERPGIAQLALDFSRSGDGFSEALA